MLSPISKKVTPELAINSIVAKLYSQVNFLINILSRFSTSPSTLLSKAILDVSIVRVKTTSVGLSLS